MQKSSPELNVMQEGRTDSPAVEVSPAEKAVDSRGVDGLGILAGYVRSVRERVFTPDQAAELYNRSGPKEPVSSEYFHTVI